MKQGFLEWLGKYNSSYGNKGVIFTLDVTIAIIIIVIALATTTFYVTRLNQQTISDLNTLRFGSDVLTIMDHQGLGYGITSTAGLLNMLRRSGSQYSIRIEIKCDSGFTQIIQGESLAIGHADLVSIPPGKIPESGFVGSGKRIFIVSDVAPMDLCTARYWVWRK